jgi:maltose alpha-D-glucosyltransferase/alpha-amylase
MIERERTLAASAPGQLHASELLATFRIQAEEVFLEAYGEGRGRPLDDAERDVIRAFAIEKAAYEIVYETNSRPDWVDIPLRGLANLLQQGAELAGE